MSNEIKVNYTTANSVYAVVLHGSGKTWNGSALETTTIGHWNSYAQYLPETSGTGIYMGNMPAITTIGAYSVYAYRQISTVATPTDTKVAYGTIHWDGTTEMHLGSARLGARGLDYVDVTEVSEKPTDFRGWMMWLTQRFRRSKLTSGLWTVMKEDGTVVTTQTLTDNGTTQEMLAP